MSRGAADQFELVVKNAAAREFIAVGIPTFGLVNIGWAMRTFGMLRHPMNRDLRYFLIQSAEVGDARNEIVAKALAAQVPGRFECSHVFFIDDDVLLHPDALLKLESDGLPIVSGLYYAKTSVPQPLILHGEAGGVQRGWRPGDLVQCWAHGMGMTLIRREVFTRLRDETELGVDVNGNPKWFATTRDSHIVRPDGVPVLQNQTEDVYFLRRAVALGYVPTVDTSSQTFGFHWAENEKRAYPLKQWKEFSDHRTITWDTDAGPVVWGENVA